MDNIDKKIIELLSENANITSTEIGDLVNLSIPAVNKRILRLQNENIIRKFTILTDGKKVNKPITAFIFIVVRFSDSIDVLLDHIRQDDDILECHALTGEYDYLLKVCALDIEDLEEKLLFLKKQKGVVKSHTMVSLMEHKFEPTILPEQ